MTLPQTEVQTRLDSDFAKLFGPSQPPQQTQSEEDNDHQD